MSEMMKKKKMEEDEDLEVDRLSSLPDELVMRIFSFFDTKHAVKASFSLKKWVNLWTLLPHIDFDNSVPKTRFNIDKFVDKVLTLRDDSVKIDKLSFTLPDGWKKEKLLHRVVEYAVAHDVKHLTICPGRHVYVHQLSSCTSLRSLKLRWVIWLNHSQRLEQLVTLHLDTVRLNGPTNFSVYPNLQDLTLDSFYEENIGRLHSQSIVAPRLLRLTISNCFVHSPYRKLLLSTPRLTFFKIKDFQLPLLQTDDLTLLDNVDIDVNWYLDRFNDVQNQKLISQLISMLSSFYRAGCIRLSSSVVELFLLFPDILAREPTPFCNLKFLNIRLPASRKTFSATIPFHLMNYLLRKCPHANIVVEMPSTKMNVAVFVLLKLLSRHSEILAREPSPFCNLKLLNVVPDGSGKTFSIPDHMTTYFLKNSPNAKIVVDCQGAGSSAGSNY